MKARTLGRAGAWIAAAWAGFMIGVGGVAAPLLFSLLPRAEAGRVAEEEKVFTVRETGAFAHHFQTIWRVLGEQFKRGKVDELAVEAR